jgi:hypothetical protein
VFLLESLGHHVTSCFNYYSTNMVFLLESLQDTMLQVVLITTVLAWCFC